MAIQNLFTSRDNNLDGNTYVGQLGRLWYNPDTNSLYASDGVTVGGIPVDLATGANITANIITLNTLTSTSGNITVTGNLVISGNISPAAAGKIGGITPGPGVDVSNEGVLTIDAANLPLSFGDFTANTNILTIVNLDEDMILATQGSAEIQLVGNIGFYKSNGLPPDASNRYFKALDDGQIYIYVSTEDAANAAVDIIGTTTGNTIAPGQPGAMLHITGQLGIPSRFYHDGNNDYVSWVARRWNGNVDTPTQVLAGEDVLRINATAATDAGVPNQAIAQITIHALENQTATTQGSEISFIATPVGEPTANRIEVANVNVANGVTATKFTTAGTISAAGNISGGNLILSSGGIISSSGLISTTANISAGNIAATGLADVTGNLSAGNVSTAGQISATGNVAAGNVNAYVVLPAGTTTKAPLIFTAGSVTTVPTVGSMNYDGRIFYGTPQGQERGLIKTAQTYVLNTDYALIDQTAVQSMFGVLAAVSSNTRYIYNINAVVYKTANNITMSYAVDGNAVLSRHTYQTLATATAGLGTLATPSILKNILTTGFGTGVVVTPALNGAGYFSIQIQGLVNVTTGGTWNPLIGFSGLPGAGSYVTAGSSVEIYPIGIGNTTVSIGNWT